MCERVSTVCFYDDDKQNNKRNNWCTSKKQMNPHTSIYCKRERGADNARGIGALIITARARRRYLWWVALSWVVMALREGRSLKRLSARARVCTHSSRANKQFSLAAVVGDSSSAPAHAHKQNALKNKHAKPSNAAVLVLTGRTTR